MRLDQKPPKDGYVTRYYCGFTTSGSWDCRLTEHKEFIETERGKYILKLEATMAPMSKRKPDRTLQLLRFTINLFRLLAIAAIICIVMGLLFMIWHSWTQGWQVSCTGIVAYLVFDHMRGTFSREYLSIKNNIKNDQKNG